MSDQTYEQNIKIGDLGAAVDVGNARREVERDHTDEFCWEKAAADAMAADATAETLMFRVPVPRGYTAGDTFGILKGLDLMCDADITGDAVDFATFTVQKRTHAAAGATAVGSITSVAGMTKWVARQFALVAGTGILVCGGSLAIAITKGGAGKIVPKTFVYARVLRQ